MQRLPILPQRSLSPEQRQHLEELSRIREEGRAAREQAAITRAADAAAAIERTNAHEAFAYGVTRQWAQADAEARARARLALPLA